MKRSHGHDGQPDHELRDLVMAAAIEAEYETGEREATEAEAKSHIIVRLVRITFGFVVTIGGLLAIPLPGPGWLIVIAGLSILARDFAWAARVIALIRRVIPGVPEEGGIPLGTWLTMGAVTLAAVAASVWWFGFDGSTTFAGWFEAFKGRF